MTHIHEQRLLWADVSRGVAALAIVILHVASYGMVEIGQEYAGVWMVATFLNSATRWAVPVFFMLSGYFLLKPASSLSLQESVRFYKKRWSRLGLPLVFWTLFYLLLRHTSSFEPGLLMDTLSHWAYTLLFDQPFEHLYFLYAICCMYGITPVLNRFVLSRKNSFRALLLASLFWALVVPSTRFMGVFWLQFIVYYLFGGWMSEQRLNLTQLRPLAFGLLFLASTFALFLGTTILTMQLHVTQNLKLLNFTHPLVMIQSVSIFLLVYNSDQFLELTLRSLKDTLIWLSKVSLGVYLLHPVVLWLVADFIGDASTMVTFSFLIVSVPVLTYGCVGLLKKVQVLNHLV